MDQFENASECVSPQRPSSFTAKMVVQIEYILITTGQFSSPQLGSRPADTLHNIEIDHLQANKRMSSNSYIRCYGVGESHLEHHSFDLSIPGPYNLAYPAQLFERTVVWGCQPSSSFGVSSVQK